MKKGTDKDEEKRVKPVIERRNDESDNTRKCHEAKRIDKEKEKSYWFKWLITKL